VDAHGRFNASVSAHISWWTWLVLMTICFLPALWSAVVGLAPERTALPGKMAV
jgi:hypothetical protein